MTSTLRCMKVLELLADEPFELSFTELAARLKIPKASAHRLCATLLEANLITQEPVTRRYMLNSHALWIGSGYVRHSPAYRAAFFPMQELARQFRGTVQLGVLDKDYVIFIHSVGYSGAPDAFADVGLRRPLNATASGNLRPSDWWTEDGSYLRLRNITLGYSIPKEWVSRMGAGNVFTRIRIYLAAQNLFTITKYKGYDPEASSFDGDFNQGVDLYQYPKAKTLAFTLNITL